MSNSEARHNWAHHSSLTDSIVAMAFSPDSKLFASGSLDGIVRIWETDKGEAYGKQIRHDDEVWSVAFSPNGKLLACLSRDQFFQLWEVESGQPYGPAYRLTSRYHRGEKIVFSPDGKKLAIKTVKMI